VTDYIVSVGQFTSNLGRTDTATIEDTGSSVHIVDGGVEIVVGGGFALSNTILGGQFTLSSGGSALGALVCAGGLETVSSGAATSGETIILSGSSLVLSGGVASAVTISSGGVEHLAGGSAYDVDVVAGGLLSGSGTLFSADDHGTVSGVTVGSSLDVFAGGVADGVTDSGLANPGDYYHEGVFVSSGASATGTTVGAAGYLELDATGSATNTLVHAGGDVAGNGGGVINGVTSNAGVISGVTVSGTLIDLAGGYDSGNVITTGATEVLSAGGSTYNDTLDRGAVLSGGGVVYSLHDLGSVSGVTVGSSLDVSAGGVAYGVIDSGLANPGAYYHEGIFVSSGGAVTGTIVGTAGYLELDSSGSATNTVVHSGGDVAGDLGVIKGVTSNAGVISGVTVSGTLIDLAGGYDFGNVIATGATEVLSVGGSTYNDTLDKGAVLSGGGVVYSLDDLGTVSGVSIGSSLNVASGGVALAVRDSGFANPGAYYHEGLFVSSGASATGTTVGLDGYLELDVTGSAAGTTVDTGGVLDGSNGGFVTDATTNSGLVENITVLGTLTDLAGGHDDNDTVAAGASDIVETGGAADNVTVSAGGQLYGGGIVSSGEIYGLVSDVTVGSSLDIQSGGVADAMIASGFANPGAYYHEGLFVHAGGQASGTIVGSAGYLELDGTGSATGVEVSAGGDVAGGGGGVLKGVTSNAGVISGVTVSGTLIDLSGSYDSGNVIAAGATEVLSAGGSTYNDTLDKGAVLSGGGVVYSLDDLGTVSGVSVGSSLEVASGGLALGVRDSGFANPGAYYHEGLFIASGASATGTTVGLNGYFELDGTGSAAGTTVAVGGVVAGNGGGVLVGQTVNSGVVSNLTIEGTFADVAGGYEYNDTIGPAAIDDLFVGGSATTVTIAHGGEIVGGGVVYSADDSGIVSGVQVGSSLEVLSGGVAQSVTISGLANPGSYYHEGLFIAVGGSATGTVVDSHGYLELDGGVAAATTVFSGGVLYDGGLANGAVVMSGGLLSGPGSAAGLIVASSGATVDLGAVVSGGVDDYYRGASESLTVSSGGVLALAGEVLSAGETLQIGLVTATEVVSGVTVLSGATVELAATLVETGETLELGTGAILSGVTLQSGAVLGGPGLLEGQIIASSGAMLSGGRLAAGSELMLSAGAVGSGLSIGNGAVVSGPGLLIGQTTDDGEICGALVRGQLAIASGGEVSGASLVPGATVSVASGGRLEGMIQLAGTVTLAIQQGATVSAESINEFYSSPPQSLTLPGGDTLELVSGVIAAGAVYTAGKQLLSATIDKVGLDPGATLALAAPIVLAGGTVDVRSGATVSGAMVSSGGALVVSSGGALVSPTVNGGVVFEGGATLAGALVGSGSVTESGGALVLSSAAAFRGEVVISSGQVELAGAGGVGAGSVDFAAGSSGTAQLVIEAVDTPAAGATFASELLNFSQDGDSVLLAGLADVGGSATAVAHGSTLVLTDGGKTYDFRLGGQIAPSFVVTALGGGVLITADPPPTSHVQLMAQAMATFGASSEAPGAPTASSLVSSTGNLIAEPHPAVTVPRHI
jgi:autotransporter passenger strand-loop-strand repeat protein